MKISTKMRAMMHKISLTSAVGRIAERTTMAGLTIHYNQVLLPDGSRSRQMSLADPERMLFRRQGQDEKFVYGHIQHKLDPVNHHHKEDLEFLDSDFEVALTNPESYILNHLARCIKVTDSIADRPFAIALYGALVGATWQLDRENYVLSARSSGKIVAGLRGWNECYADFLGTGSEGMLRFGIQEILEDNRFHLREPFDWEASAELALEILTNCEMRPQKTNPPDWFGRWIGESDSGHEIFARMARCCLQNQVSLVEFEQFMILASVFDE